MIQGPPRAQGRGKVPEQAAAADRELGPFATLRGLDGDGGLSSDSLCSDGSSEEEPAIDDRSVAMALQWHCN